MNLMSNAGAASAANDGPAPASNLPVVKKLNIFVCPATGGQHNVAISPCDSISELKRVISRQMHVPQDRIKLLFKETVLDEGKVSDYSLYEGCKITLIPALKCGFSSTVQGPQQSIVQAIEGLSDEQIDDFLSGQAPLTLALRAGDHMMFIQLNLQHYVNDAPKQHDKAFSDTERSCNCQEWKCFHVIRQMINSPSQTDKPSTSRDSSSASSLSSGSQRTCEATSENQSRPVRTKTYGRITSGIGSLTNPGSFGSGSRFLRQMQRLRRLCGGHQQCVAYSSREVASEISSIVHSSRQTSTGDSRSSRNSGKLSSRDHTRKSSGNLRHDASFATSQSYPTRIDSVTAHGPGVFSGAFSGTLDSSIHDEQGKLKREPKTVLQILTELLTATEKYEKQSGNFSVMSQLFKDHFTSLSNSSRTDDSAASSTSQKTNPSSSSSQRKRRHSSRDVDARSSHPLFAPHHKLSRTNLWNYPFKDGLFSGPNDALTSSRLLSTCRRLHQSPASWLHSSPIIQSKIKRIQALMNNPRIQRLRHDNDKTGLKMAYLRHLMDEKRKQKTIRKLTSVSEQKPQPVRENMVAERTHLSGRSLLEPLRRTSLEVHASEIAQFSDDRQPEVTHETAETATV